MGLVALLGAAGVILFAWVRYELKVPESLVDMRMMRRRAVLATNLTGLLIGFSISAVVVLLAFAASIGIPGRARRRERSRTALAQRA